MIWVSTQVATLAVIYCDEKRAAIRAIQCADRVSYLGHCANYTNGIAGSILRFLSYNRVRKGLYAAYRPRPCGSVRGESRHGFRARSSSFLLRWRLRKRGESGHRASTHIAFRSGDRNGASVPDEAGSERRRPSFRL